MAVYFELHRNGEPVKFNAIDDEMCAALGVEPDPVEYHKFWYDTIGFSLACGQSWDQIRETWGERKGDVIDFLEENFQVICYGGR